MILKAYKLLLTTLLLEGLLAFIMLFSERSMQRNAALLGFSAARIALGALTLCALGLLVWWALMAVREAPALLRFDQRLDYFNQHQSHLLVIFTGLGLSFFYILFLLVIFPRVGQLTSSFLSSPFDNLITTIIAIINRIRPLLVWALLAILQSVIFLFSRFRKTCLQNSFFSFETIYYLSLSAFILPVTLFHWAILYYQLYVFSAIPYWFWKFFEKPSINDWLIIPLSIIAILIISLVLWFPKKTRRNLVLLLVMGYLLQVGFGFIEDSGFERLRRNFMEKGHHGYAQYAAQGTNLVELITHYETIAESDPFFMTKPPGVVSFYVAVNHISSLFVNDAHQPPGLQADAQYESLTLLLALVFPLLSVLVLIPLSALSKNLLDQEHANLPGLLFIFIPSFILTPLYLDQGLYPLLFIGGLLAGLQIQKTNAPGWGFAAGIIAYLAIFFSFSLLPLIPVILLWTGLDFFFNLKQRSLVGIIKVILMFFLGFAIMHLLFKLLLNYDFILRYQNALAQHRLHKDYLSGVQQIIDAAVLNNTEFAAWLGFPVVILFISAIIRTLTTFLRSKPVRKDTLLLAFLMTFIALNIMGQTRSEVARLWLFMVPIVSLFASTEARFLLSGLFNGKKRITFSFLYLIVLQLGTIFLTFKYQDLD